MITERISIFSVIFTNLLVTIVVIKLILGLTYVRSNRILVHQIGPVSKRVEIIPSGFHFINLDDNLIWFDSSSFDADTISAETYTSMIKGYVEVKLLRDSVTEASRWYFSSVADDYISKGMYKGDEIELGLKQVSALKHALALDALNGVTHDFAHTRVLRSRYIK